MISRNQINGRDEAKAKTASAADEWKASADELKYFTDELATTANATQTGARTLCIVTDAHNDEPGTTATDAHRNPAEDTAAITTDIEPKTPLYCNEGQMHSAVFPLDGYVDTPVPAVDQRDFRAFIRNYVQAAVRAVACYNAAAAADLRSRDVLSSDAAMLQGTRQNTPAASNPRFCERADDEELDNLYRRHERLRLRLEIQRMEQDLNPQGANDVQERRKKVVKKAPTIVSQLPTGDRCFNCSRMGHRKPTCLYEDRPIGVCFNCWVTGHNRKTCQNPRYVQKLKSTIAAVTEEAEDMVSVAFLCVS